ncbi:MAG: 50S ribosomal protein L5 [Armatimonadetes bacterium]|nr:50S ribosomal protein L5 [Armatimonadota bacterium]
MADAVAEIVPRLQERYRNEIVPGLMEEFKYRNVMQVPRIEKVVVNMGVGIGKEDAKLVQAAADDLARITGQRPKINKARKSISNFKLREGMSIGCCCTLRGHRMWEFLDRLIAIALPRIRDFRGLSPTGVDGHGNYSLGLREQTVFPEIDPDRVTRVQGMNITIVTSAPTDAEALALLKRLGLPLQES